jgi:hypothetical protein
VRRAERRDEKRCGRRDERRYERMDERRGISAERDGRG